MNEIPVCRIWLYVDETLQTSTSKVDLKIFETNFIQRNVTLNYRSHLTLAVRPLTLTQTSSLSSLQRKTSSPSTRSVPTPFRRLSFRHLSTPPQVFTSIPWLVSFPPDETLKRSTSYLDHVEKYNFDLCLYFISK